MLSNKDINFDDATQILTINGEEHPVGDPSIPGEIEALEDRVTALENAGGVEWAEIYTMSTRGDGGDYGTGNISYKGIGIFESDTKIKELMFIIVAQDTTKIAPAPLYVPLEIFKTSGKLGTSAGNGEAFQASKGSGNAISYKGSGFGTYTLHILGR